MEKKKKVAKRGARIASGVRRPKANKAKNVNPRDTNWHDCLYPDAFTPFKLDVQDSS